MKPEIFIKIVDKVILNFFSPQRRKDAKIKTSASLRLCGIFILFFSFSICFSQEDEIEKRIENTVENTESDVDYSTLIENLEYFKEQPLNINTASEGELKELFLLNSLQINNLINHIKTNGKLISLYELQSIDGFDNTTIMKILPYIKIDSCFILKLNFKNILSKGENQFLFRSQKIIEQQKGFTSITDSAYKVNPNSRYIGNPFRMYSRYRFKYNNQIDFGITAEKDAGEEFFRGTQKNGFDFYSAHLVFKNIGLIKTIAIGDYQIDFGQGLVLNSGFSVGKSSDAINIIKNPIGIKPYTGVDENVFFRGIATTLKYKKIKFSALFSNKKLDANIVTVDSSDFKPEVFSSLQQNGLHTIPNEISDKDAVNEIVYGTNITYEIKKMSVGITAINSLFSASLQKTLHSYNQFEFNGRNNFIMGSDYNFSFRNFMFSGEIARSENGGIAFLNSAIAAINQQVSFAFLQRNYQRNFQNLYGKAFGANTINANEKGTYSGIILNPLNNFNISAYYDIFSFPWLKYQVDAPSHGYDYFAQLEFIPSKKVNMYFYFKEKSKAMNIADYYIDYIENYCKQNYRYNISYRISRSLLLKNRAEYVVYKVQNEIKYGYLLSQDITYKSFKDRYSVSFRFALFDADDYDTRIYAYENDVLYSYSLPSYFYKGYRTYINLSYVLNRNLELWLRYARTTYANKNVIGNGLTEIEGNTKSEIKIQMRMKF
ncbi:MAG: helix-hairpin-helix domain-containing protein [Bacteroidales bacterium]|nr:helix-hairpin-helix domain-containing protein [Bacteroidales bacterium]